MGVGIAIGISIAIVLLIIGLIAILGYYLIKRQQVVTSDSTQQVATLDL